MVSDEGMGQCAAGVTGPQFVHLRVHSAFSLLEGALPLKKIIGKAVADDQPATPITYSLRSNFRRRRRMTDCSRS
jgi:DNA polymerase-3 subunit alpha